MSSGSRSSGQSSGGGTGSSASDSDSDPGGVDACNFGNVECSASVSGTFLDSTVTFTASVFDAIRGGNVFISSTPILVSGYTEPDGKNRKLGADAVFDGALVIGALGATTGAIYGAAYALSHLGATMAVASATGGFGGLLIGAAGVADIGMLAGVGAMTVGGAAFLGGIVIAGAIIYAHNTWFADGN